MHKYYIWGARLIKCHEFSQGWIWAVSTWVTDITFLINYTKGGGGGYVYRMIVNTPIPENINENDKWWYDTTIQNFILNNYLDLKYASGKRKGPDVPHIINQATLNDGKICVGNESWWNLCVNHVIRVAEVWEIRC